eukprot:GHUV01032689.1.p2 GENE.GHUV01032689.1~~GHUV01032689.1.p2  ORF type:complete len:103 (+),score=9.73 GHUV01032689.1:874-1182(+)
MLVPPAVLGRWEGGWKRHKKVPDMKNRAVQPSHSDVVELLTSNWSLEFVVVLTRLVISLTLIMHELPYCAVSSWFHHQLEGSSQQPATISSINNRDQGLPAV